MKLIVNEWKSAHKMLSMWVATLAVAFGAMPPDMQAAVLEALHVPQNRIAAVIGGLFMVGRMVNQGSATKDDADSSDEKADK